MIEVIQSLYTAIMSSLFTWSGGDWVRQPIIWGYSDTVTYNEADTALAAGTNTLVGDEVPAGEVWKIESVSFVYTGTSPTECAIRPNTGDGAIYYHSILAPTSGQTYTFSGQLTIKAGGKIRLVITGATLNDACRLSYGGYRMELTN